MAYSTREHFLFDLLRHYMICPFLLQGTYGALLYNSSSGFDNLCFHAKFIFIFLYPEVYVV